jgi:hypothetical protein
MFREVLHLVFSFHEAYEESRDVERAFGGDGEIWWGSWWDEVYCRLGLMGVEVGESIVWDEVHIQDSTMLVAIYSIYSMESWTGFSLTICSPRLLEYVGKQA